MVATRDLMLVVVGGVIGVLGGLATSIATYQLGVRENQRLELNRAYAEWGSEFQHALETEKDQYLFGAYESIKEIKKQNAPRPPFDIVGRNGDEIALEASKAKILFKAALTRLLFLETRSEYAERIRKISHIEYEYWSDKGLEIPTELEEVKELDILTYKKKLLDFNAIRADCLELFLQTLQGGKKKMNSKEPNKNC